MKPDKFGCLGSTIKVASGHYVDLSNPDPETLDLHSIGVALSRICRFGGHCPRFYSVAEHSLLASVLAANDGCSMAIVRAVFLHDAAEAFIGDLVKPLKILLPQYHVIEQRFEEAIARRFNVDFEAHEEVIKRYDRLMLKSEKTTLWPEDAEAWQDFATIEERKVGFRFHDPDQACINFLGAASYLGIK